MTLPPDLIRRLRNTPVRELVRALGRDGFVYRRTRVLAEFTDMKMAGEPWFTSTDPVTRFPSERSEA